MKAHHLLAAILIILSFRFSYSQNEVERYKQPELIEGSNLLVNASPYYSNDILNDSVKSSDMSVCLGADFTKWRYTPKLDYSIAIQAGFCVARAENNYSFYDSYDNHVNNYSSSSVHLEGGLSYYPFKKPVYGGLYFNSEGHFNNHSKPSSQNDFYAYLGYGRLLNAGQVIFAKNFENVLLDEKVITQKLPRSIIEKLTLLLDKRYNWEFFSRYREDADIEFFSQIEQLLLDEKIIKSQLGSRAILKLFQALTNTSFVNYPRYRGYLLQAELNYNNISFYEARWHNNSLWANITGLYGIPLGIKTNLLASAFFSLPLSKSHKNIFSSNFYHSPYTLKEGFPYSDPLIYDLNYSARKDIFDYIAGTKLIAFHNFSNTFGAAGFLSFIYGKTEEKENDYTINATAQLRYNILSKLYFATNMVVYRTRFQKLHFSTTIDFGYIIF